MNRMLELLVDLWMFGAPVVLMVWSLLRLMRHAPGRVRYVLAIAGLLATLALPLMASFLGRNPMARERAAVFGLVPGEPSAGPVAAEWLAPLLALSWAVGALLLITRDAVGHLRLRRIREAARSAPEGLQHELQWPSSVPLLIGDCPSPYTLGLIKPAVILPADLTFRFTHALVARMARHELAHARWRDPLFHALLRTLAALFWISPVWLVLRWVRREREVAADESALAGTNGEEVQYVELLLGLSRDAARGEHSLAAGVAATDLEYRARCILEPRKWYALLTAGLVFVASAALASIPAPAQIAQREDTKAGPADVAIRTRPSVSDHGANSGTETIDRHDDGARVVDVRRKVDRRVEESRVVRVEVHETDDMPPPRLRAWLNRFAAGVRARHPR